MFRKILIAGFLGAILFVMHSFEVTKRPQPLSFTPSDEMTFQRPAANFARLDLRKGQVQYVTEESGVSSAKGLGQRRLKARKKLSELRKKRKKLAKAPQAPKKKVTKKKTKKKVAKKKKSKKKSVADINTPEKKSGVATEEESDLLAENDRESGYDRSNGENWTTFTPNVFSADNQQTNTDTGNDPDLENTEDGDDELVYSVWKRRLFSNQDLDTVAEFTRAHLTDEISAPVFHKLVNEILGSDNKDFAELGLVALSGVPSLESFRTLASLTGEDSSFKDAAENELRRYSDISRISVVKSALLDSDPEINGLAFNSLSNLLSDLSDPGRDVAQYSRGQRSLQENDLSELAGFVPILEDLCIDSSSACGALDDVRQYVPATDGDNLTDNPI